MRLSSHYRHIIKIEAEKIFGQDTQVFLFGSRVDDSKKGGDIDLYIVGHNQQRLIEQEAIKWAVLI